MGSCIQIDLRNIQWQGVYWTRAAGFCKYGHEPKALIKTENFLTS